jgi:hypothetical protein
MRASRTVGVVLAGAVSVVSVVACKIVEEGPPQAAPGTPPPPPPAAPAPAAAQPAAAPATPAPAAPAHKVALHLGSGGAAPATPAVPPAGIPPAAGCLDRGAVTVPDCSTLQAPSPSCAAFTTAQQKCAAYKNNFSTKVAASAVACLASSTAAQLCDPTRPLACARAALAQACPDPNVGQLCQIAAGPCKAAPADCTTTLSGLNSQGQQSIAQCVATGCGAGLPGCIDTLK